MNKIKSLNILIKIKNKILQDQQYKIKKINHALYEANKMIEYLSNELQKESQWTQEENNIYLESFASYSRGVHQKINILHEQKKILQKSLHENINKLNEYFLEKKRLEIIFSQQLQKLKIEMLKKEEKNLDSLIMDRVTNNFIINHLHK